METNKDQYLKSKLADLQAYFPKIRWKISKVKNDLPAAMDQFEVLTESGLRIALCDSFPAAVLIALAPQTTAALNEAYGIFTHLDNGLPGAVERIRIALAISESALEHA